MGKVHWFIAGNILGFALLIGGIAATESFKKHNRQDSPDSQESQAAIGQSSINQNGSETESKIVTTHDISKGTVIRSEDLQIREIEKGKTHKDELKSMAQAIGKKTKLDLVEGEILLRSDMSENR